MHRGPERVGLEAKEEFEDAGIRFRTNVSAAGSKVFAAHGWRPQSSSFRKMPRYLTDGGPKRCVPAGKTRVDFFCGGTSAHQYHGETPIAAEIS